MSTFRFVHAADLHLDTPFQGIACEDAAVADALRDASLNAFDRLIDFTIRERAACLLLAGDIYDGAERGVRAQFRFLRGLEKLSAHGIRTFIVHGNHDPLDGWSAIHRWPDEVTVFPGGEVAEVPLSLGGEQLATVYGISYPKRNVSENLALRFKRNGNPGLHIGLLHGNLGGSGEHAPYSPFEVDDLVRAGMDYWALGHIHRQMIRQEGSSWIVYPGNLQGRSPKPSERGAKGAVLVDVEGTRIHKPVFEPLDEVRFILMEQDIAEHADLPSLLDALKTRAAEAQLAEGNRALIIRAVLKGRGALHSNLQRAAHRDGLLQELREVAPQGTAFQWWESIRVETGQLLDRSALAAGKDFRAALLQRCDTLADSPAGLQGLLEETFDPQMKGDLIRYLREIQGPDAAELLERAETLALDLLMPEEEA